MRGRGFTLLELLVTLAVASILLVVGVPSFSRMMAANQRQTNAAAVFVALNYARSEAIARNVNVAVCPSADGSSCGSAAWHEGWLIFANLDDPLAGGEPDSGDSVLHRHGPLTGGYTLTSSTFTTGVVYLPIGRAKSDGQFLLCAPDAEIEDRLIEITSTGLVRTAPHHCGSGG